MNLGQAVALCLYELIRSDEAAERRPAGRRLAGAAEIERLHDLLAEALRVSGYTKQKTAASTEQKLRRMVRRLSLNQEDARLWQGMVRQMLWKMRQQGGSALD
jgi:tRNA/rRNA methyltransferase